MTKRHLTIATRESPLALRQTEWVRDRLLAAHPGLAIDFLGITTHADKRLDVTLDKIGGKGLFVKELEEALYDGRADIAVHSMKDVPMILPPDLSIPVVCERVDPRDAFVSHRYASLLEMPHGAVVGTSSLRRKAQIAKLRPDLIIQPLRGNIHTRLKRLDDGDYDGIILAAAGLKRMDFSSRIREFLATQICLPAAGQGALGVECRSEDTSIIDLLLPLNHSPTHYCVSAERAVCRHLQGGCMVPVAAFAQMQQDNIYLRALVANTDGKKIIQTEQSGHFEAAEKIGNAAAEILLEQGADKILSEFHGQV